MNKTRLEAIVARHEGYRMHMYKCSAGKLTIGYGYNLEAGMPEDEARLLLRYRLDKLAAQLAQQLPWYAVLKAERKEVLIDMAYQMGIAGLLGFRKALAAMGQGDWSTAAKEMLDSKWARADSPGRAKELAEIMRTGTIQ